ncbi:MAG TPA: glycosyltransferase family 1 protein, partial [Candidatus Aquilonibacter sp.]
VRGLIEALRELGEDVVGLCEPKLDPWRFDRRVFWDQVLLPQRTRQSAPDLLHCASGTVPLGLTIPYVVTVHDVAWLRVQAHARPYARYYFGRFSVDRYRGAAAIAVDSAFSRSELLEVMPDLDSDRVRVVYPGVAADFCDLERKGSDGKTILVVGTVERRKNLEMIVNALPFLDGARLVAVGPYTPYQDECLETAQMLQVDDRVEFRGYVAREDLLALYGSAAVIAMPSRYEGFGYAAAQGLCAGIPVVVSDCSSLPEIVGDAGRVVPLDGVQGWVDALRAALRGDDDARASGVRMASIERFAWSNSARDMIAAYTLALQRA